MRERHLLTKAEKMVPINLTTEEIQLLRNLIEACLDDLWVEIQATDNMGYKDMLRTRKVTLVKLLGQLSQTQNLPLAE